MVVCTSGGTPHNGAGGCSQGGGQQQIASSLGVRQVLQLRGRRDSLLFSSPVNRRGAPRWGGPAKILDIDETRVAVECRSQTCEVARYCVRKKMEQEDVTEAEWNGSWEEDGCMGMPWEDGCMEWISARGYGESADIHWDALGSRW